MDFKGSHAMSSARELRRTTGCSSASARLPAHHRRGAPRSVVCANWFRLRKTPVTIGEAEVPDVPPSSAPASIPSGTTPNPTPAPNPTPTTPISTSTSSDADFLRRVRKMQRRIAKLKQLQERLSQLREERDLLQAYAEVEASAAESDSDAEDSDDHHHRDGQSPPASNLPPASGPRPNLASSTGAGPTPSPRLSPGSTSSPGSSPASAPGPGSSQWPPSLRSPGPSASPEELRSWVAALVAQSAARASAGLGTPGPGGEGSGEGSAAASSGSSTAGIPLDSSSSSSSSNKVGSARQGVWDKLGAASPLPPPPPPSAAAAAATDRGQPATTVPPPATAGGRSSSSSSSYGYGSSGSPRASSSAAPAPPKGPAAPAPATGAAAVGGGGGAVRRYTVRYSPTSSKPVFVPLPSDGPSAAAAVVTPISPVTPAVGAVAAPSSTPSMPGPPPPPPLPRDAASTSASVSPRSDWRGAAASLAAAAAAAAPPSSATSSSSSPSSAVSAPAAAPPPRSPTAAAVDRRGAAAPAASGAAPLAQQPPSPTPPTLPPTLSQRSDAFLRERLPPPPPPLPSTPPPLPPPPPQQQGPMTAEAPAPKPGGRPAVASPVTAGAVPPEGTATTAAGAAAAAADPSSSSSSSSSSAAATPLRDPNAELRSTAFPEALTSTNPYTLYDMPLPPLPLPKSWQTAAERAAAAAAPPPPGGAAGSAGSGGLDLADRPRDLVFVTAEAAPWSKTGGLGDVMGALPRALAARGHRVMVVSPRYLAASTEGRYAGLTDTGVRARLDLGRPGGGGGGGGGGVHEVGYFHTHRDGVDWVFVDHMSYHREGTPYGNEYGTYGDNLFRFSLLALAACEAPLLLHIGGFRSGSPPGLPYGQAVTFIANDWHAGLVPVYVAAKYRRHGVYREARCVLALHNLAHQGAHPPHCFGSLGLPGEWYGALEWVQTPGAGAGGTAGSPERIPTINVLKAALVTSDRLVTVSPAYAWEITAGEPRSANTTTTNNNNNTSSGSSGNAANVLAPAAKTAASAPAAVATGPLGAGAVVAGGASGGGGGGRVEDHGMGLGSLLRQRAAELAGIVNGIDTGEWDPRTDPYLPRNYHEGSLGGKGLCKAALQQSLGLPPDPAAPLLGFIGRLDYQKGPDLVLQALPKLVAAGCQVVLLGSGAADYEEAFRAAAASYPANVRAHVGFSVPLSHRILAAADILLMPSRFEPCGLNQLYAMRYGTVPVAHGTGGLRDTIDDVKPFLGERAAAAARAAREAEEDLEELFAKGTTAGLAWGRRTAPRSADDPSTNNAEYYQPFQDYFGSSGRYGPVSEEYDEYDDDEYDIPYDDGEGEAAGGGRGGGGDLSRWRRVLGPAEGDVGALRRGDPGTGWTFSPATAEAMLDAVTAALAVYEHLPDKWRRIQVAGMRRDWSWSRAARQWEAVLEGVHAGAAYCK
ncbi:hypothetical protein PLESTF_001514700 [Pleodorina starrii]|nr:hypothetical protein PLESTF_001514700 [Pleodorina starrii]